MLATLPQGDEVFVADGYIRVFQDVRGKYGSEGDYVMTRPLRGPLNPSATDHVTDAYDTIDWLVKNVPESNGKVGMLGCSYEGFTVVMALLDPHPALKVAAPRARWSTAGWATTGSTTAPSARPTSTTSPARPPKRGDGESVARRATTTTRPSAAPVRPAPTRKAARPRPAALVAQDHRASRLRRLLAGPGARQD